MVIQKQPSCDDVSEPALLPVSEAKKRISALVPALTDVETVNTTDSAGRVLMAPVVSDMLVPAATNSAMDGYAISASDIPSESDGERTLTLVGEAYAGREFEGSLATGETVRVFTGAVLPQGADTVVIQEHVDANDDSVTIDHTVQSGRNVRHAGEDLQIGDTVLHTGRRLSAADVGLIASLGIRSVTVSRQLRVAFFSTGDEVQALESTANDVLPRGMVYDSNRHTLRSLLTASGVEVIDLGIVRDTFDETLQALEKAAREADVVISSGGISAGDADYVTKAFHQLGNVSFWKMAMRPGRPLACGTIGRSVFFGLPGNPVAVMVTFLAFVLPALKQRMGMTEVEPFAVSAIAKTSIKKSPGRTEYQRGVATLRADGVLEVELTGKQGAGRLSSMSVANCLIVMDDTVDAVSAGDSVTVWPFEGLLP